MSKSAIEQLMRLLEGANVKVCLCFICSHQPSHGPCSACGCKNPPYEKPKPK